jgi:lipoprotein Spr
MKNIFFFILITVGLSCQPSVRYSSGTEPSVDSEQRKQAIPARLSTFIRDWLHTPYRYGGNGKNGIDCSGLVVQFMQDVYGIQVPRQAQDQYVQGKKITKSRLQAGNLVFFSVAHGRSIDHVGVYIGEGQFIHASESEGVIISDLNETFYSENYFGACRY